MCKSEKGGNTNVNHKDIKLAINMHNSKNYSISEITKATDVNKTTPKFNQKYFQDI